ncbi:MAG: hypothetical protein KME26_04585 [Oscillatoria princeps RMCB-10]|jgi:hypothetical protein|nr:hypothetical protein [Oscillatoria princeps RMCB-10]
MLSVYTQGLVAISTLVGQTGFYLQHLPLGDKGWECARSSSGTATQNPGSVQPPANLSAYFQRIRVCYFPHQ